MRAKLIVWAKLLVWGKLAVWAKFSVWLAALTAALFPGIGPWASPATAQQPQPAQSSLLFIENSGQFDPAVRLVLHSGDQTVWLTGSGELWLTLFQAAQETHGPELLAAHGVPGRAASQASASRARADVRLYFKGANPQPTLEPFDRQAVQISYFKGSQPEGWHTGVPVWGGVRYRELYPGIDLEVSGEDGRLAPRLVARPEADLESVRLMVEGAAEVSLEGNALALETGAGELRLSLFALVGRASSGRPQLQRLGSLAHPANGAAFEIRAPFISPAALGAADPLPEGQLVYSTFLGSGSGAAVALDGQGAAYVSGATYAASFPLHPGDTDPGCEGEACPTQDLDVFVAKLDASGSQLAYAVFLGGDKEDAAYAVGVDGQGSAYLTGSTQPCDAPGCGFPVTPGALQSRAAGSGDAFAVRLAPDAATLEYSTLLGGSEWEEAYTLAVAADGSLFIGGASYSPDFPTTADAYISSFRGTLYDAFVAQLDADGTALRYSTYLGGSAGDMITGLAVDEAGAVYAAGTTGSADFPTTSGAFDRSCGFEDCTGDNDAFLAKLLPGGDTLAYATYLGGGSDDWGAGVAVDADGGAYVAGGTWSASFPTTPGAFDPACGSDGLCDATFLDRYSDGFVVKVTADGSSLAYGTFLGGSGIDEITALAVSEQGVAYAAGSTLSADFPTSPDAMDGSCGADGTCNQSRDAFVARFNPSGAQLNYATFLGGEGWDEARAAALAADGSLVVTGLTESVDFPTTPGAYRTTLEASEAYVTRFKFSTPGEDGGNSVPDAPAPVYLPLINGVMRPVLILP